MIYTLCCCILACISQPPALEDRSTMRTWRSCEGSSCGTLAVHEDASVCVEVVTVQPAVNEGLPHQHEKNPGLP